MIIPESTEQELTGWLIEDISQKCQFFEEGETVFGYAVQSVREPVPELAHVTCAECGPIPRRRFTLGIRELIVRGHAGTLANTRTQTTKRVLLEPEIERISPAHTDEPYPPDPRTWPDGSVAERFGLGGDAAGEHKPPTRMRTDGGRRVDHDPTPNEQASAPTTDDAHNTDAAHDDEPPSHPTTESTRQLTLTEWAKSGGDEQ